MSSTSLTIAALAAAVAGLLVAEWRQSRIGVWIMKPLASTLFIAIALQSGALSSGFGQLILLALVLSWFGDVFLIGERSAAFIAGLSAFLLAHVAFAAAFLTQPLEFVPMVYAGLLMAIVARVVLGWLWPGLPPALRLPVIAYVLVIALMVAVAGGTISSHGLLLLAPAVVFAASDIFVARERFVQSSLVNRLWGLPLYYGAQLAFALGVAAA